MSSRLWYLAHPVASDSSFSREENLEHTVKVGRILFEAGFEVVCPWYFLCVALAESGDNRERCLQADCDVVERCGNIILTGHRLSSGMRRELEALRNRAGCHILDLIGVPDKELSDAVVRRFFQLQARQ